MIARFAFAAALLAAPSAFAAQTPWQEVAPDVRLRLIADDVRNASGVTRLGIEIDMPQNYKTYWVTPGESGIPTEIDWTGSSGIGKAEMAWPFPTVEVLGGLTDYVYHGPTVLPVELAVEGDKPSIKAAVVMGVCSDICVPVMASFTLDLDFAAPDRGQGVRLAQALATTPIAWDKPKPAIGNVTYDAKAGGLEVSVLDQSVDQSSLIASTQDTSLIFGPPQKSREQNLVFLPLLGNDAQKGFMGGSVQLTFMTDSGPYEVFHDVGLAGVTSGRQ
jgi:DsbC/DsbD-like thiol-disulfide interchange protein